MGKLLAAHPSSCREPRACREEGLQGVLLTLSHLSLLADVPGVQGGSLLRLHGGALVEVLGQVRLVEAGGVDHLALRDVVLLQVGLDHLRHAPRVLPGRRARAGPAQWGWGNPAGRAVGPGARIPAHTGGGIVDESRP